MAVAISLMAAACGGVGDPEPVPEVALGEKGEDGEEKQGQPRKAAKPRKVDPRKGGFEIGFGEFAVTLEAAAIRPGPVTFVVRNGGKLVHGFEMEAEGGDDDNSGSGSDNSGSGSDNSGSGSDNSGPGGGGDDDGFKIERPSFGPGETIRVRLDLAPGLYKIECWVGDHDDLGMEILLEVRADAPKVRQAPAGGASRDQVSIAGFAFEPETIEVAAGTEVTWINQDPAEHTVTAKDDSFGSDPLGKGQTFAATFEETGHVAYFCAIHPTMKGTVNVA